MPDPIVPEPEHEAQPIPGPGFEKPTIKDKPVCVPAMVTHYSKIDYFVMGARRSLKVALYGAGAAVLVSGIGFMAGVPFLLALEGSALSVGGTAIIMGAAKIGEEKAKAEGKTPISEKMICTLITIIVTAIQAILNARKKGGTK